MKTTACPQCRAEIREIEANRTNPVSCPFCGRDVSELTFEDYRVAAEYAPTSDAANRAPMRSRDRRERQAAPIAPIELSPDSGVRIEEELLSQLRFSMSAVRHGSVRNSLTIGLAQGLAICLVLMVFISSTLIRIFPFGSGGALIAFGLLFVCFGRITTTVGPEEISVWWHVGPFGKTRSVPVFVVEKVVVDYGLRHTSIVMTRDQELPLTFFHRRRTDGEVAGLVRWQLERLGRTLP